MQPSEPGEPSRIYLQSTPRRLISRSPVAQSSSGSPRYRFGIVSPRARPRHAGSDAGRPPGPCGSSEDSAASPSTHLLIARGDSRGNPLVSMRSPGSGRATGSSSPRRSGSRAESAAYFCVAPVRLPDGALASPHRGGEVPNGLGAYAGVAALVGHLGCTSALPTGEGLMSPTRWNSGRDGRIDSTTGCVTSATFRTGRGSCSGWRHRQQTTRGVTSMRRAGRTRPSARGSW